MKKLLSFMLVLIVGITVVACENIQTRPTVDSLKELEDVIENDVENTLAELEVDFESLKNQIATYEQYKANTTDVEAFYDKVYSTQQSLTIRLREYSIKYVETVLALDIDIDDKYDKLGEVYDIIYKDAGEDICDGIYDGILDDMYDVYYNGILDDAYGSVSFSEWSDLRSDEFERWSNSRSDVFDDWSDFRSDVHDFCSDIRGEVWDDDIEKANEKLEDFKEDLLKLK